MKYINGVIDGIASGMGMYLALWVIAKVVGLPLTITFGGP